jgi:hypothetical protein
MRRTKCRRGGPGRRYTVQLPLNWIKVASSGDRVVVTRDGFGLQHVSIHRVPAKEAFSKLKKGADGKLLPSELAELHIAELKSPSEQMATLVVTEARQGDRGCGNPRRVTGGIAVVNWIVAGSLRAKAMRKLNILKLLLPTGRLCESSAPSGSSKITGILFYSLVAAWVIGIVLGMVLGLPYVSRTYAGVTLPLFGGITLLAMAVSDCCTGSIWRAGARAIERRDEPRFFWLAIATLACAGAFLLWFGIRNRIALP